MSIRKMMKQIKLYELRMYFDDLEVEKTSQDIARWSYDVCQEFNDDVEMWKVISDYPKYKVSSFGRVWREPDVIRRMKGSDGILKQYGIRCPCVNLHRDSIIPDKVDVAYIVAKVFLNNPNGCVHVKHIDGNPVNNKASNLEWC